MNIYNFLALTSALAFSSASIVFTLFARKLSVMWINAFKSVAALIAFFIAFLVTKDFSVVPRGISVMCFFLSGFLGLNAADFFMVRAYRVMGPARALMIFSFQPLFLGLFAFFLFGQEVPVHKLFGIFFMISCVLCIGYERFRVDRKWQFEGPVLAFVALILDGCGILLTREAFQLDASVTVLEANFYRCVGSCFGFVVISQFYRIDLSRKFFRLSTRARILVAAGGLIGTFVSLWMYLTAISKGHLATVSAIVGTAPVFAAIFESIVTKKKPSIYLAIASILFATGFYFVLRG